MHFSNGWIAREYFSSVKKALDESDMEKINLIVSDYSPRMETMIEDCSAIINIKEFTSQQDVIDDYFDDEDDDENINAQDAIDNLFDWVV